MEQERGAGSVFMGQCILGLPQKAFESHDWDFVYNLGIWTKASAGLSGGDF